MDEEVRRITKEKLDYYKNHIEECDITILRALYIDLKNESVPKDKIIKLLEKHKQIKNNTDRNDIEGLMLCNLAIGILSELLDVSSGVCADMTYCASTRCGNISCRRHMIHALLIPSWHPISMAQFDENGTCQDFISKGDE